ncbi:putative lipid II flippase FtsW [Rhodococcus marinonascens]|uniref:putative lipid II flippase FtsW n=1 Tax=Rhodococcus marinonascens TaxID=38311 RepID=UPI0009327AFC|nr:putative lipid II flippase FtsW [Rhodococcus marinonascens]
MKTRSSPGRRGSESRVPAGETAGTGGGVRRPRTRFGVWMARPLFDFHVITGVTVVLLTIGLMMVLSSSSVVAYLNTGSPYSMFMPQVIYALIGCVIFVIVVRVPTEWLRRVAVPGLVLLCVLLVLVLFLGEEQMGSRAWFTFSGFSFQPSELGKVALALWAAHLIATFTAARVEIDRALPALATVSVLMLGLVVLQKDLGMMIILGIIFMSALWFGGVNIRWVSGIAAGAVAAALILGFTAGYRSDRIQAFLNPSRDPQGLNYQSNQAKFALANGGFFGTGLGQSDAKWSYLPQSYNDFIFAVIGEETGLIGALSVLGLFAAVLAVGMRISRRQRDPFLKVLVAVATTWIVAQAFINIACVVGLLPVTGLQLPLISAGGTSMLSTMVMFGLIAHAALREPEAVASLSNGPRNLSVRVFGAPRAPVRRSPAPRYVHKSDESRTTRPRAARRAETRRTADVRRSQRRSHSS